LKACRLKKANLKRDALQVPKAPQKEMCLDPTLYPGSKTYRKMVYHHLPKGLKVELPYPCLDWKGGCAAKSTFDGGAVFLKRHGKSCGLNALGQMSCTGALPGEFKFVKQRANCTRAKLVALHTESSPHGERSCRFAPSLESPAMKVACKKDKSLKAEVELSYNPDSVGRTGTVTLKFAPLAFKQMTLNKALAWSKFNKHVEYSCSNGGLTSIWTEHMGKDVSKDEDIQDRRWKHQCLLFPPGAGQAGTPKYPDKYQNKLKGNFTAECPKHYILAGHKSVKDKLKKDRHFKFACAKLPPGMHTIRTSLWSTNWTAPAAAWQLQCARMDEILVGLDSFYDNATADRKWRRRCARVAPVRPKPITFEIEYSRGL